MSTCVDSWWALPARANPAASKAMARIDRLVTRENPRISPLTPVYDLALVGLAVVGVVATDRYIRRTAGVLR